MNKYIPISSVITYLDQELVNKMGGEDNVIAKAYDIYNTLSLAQKLMRYVKIVEITNGTIDFDTESAQNIHEVYWYRDEPVQCTDTCFKALACTQKTDREIEAEEIMNTCGAQEFIRRYSCVECSLYYEIFINSPVWSQCKTPIHKTGMHEMALCDECAPDQYNYSIDASQCLRTNAPDGYAFIVYTDYVMMDGETTIIRDNDIFDYIRLSMLCSWYTSDLSRMKGFVSLYQSLLSQRDILRNKVRGKYLLQGVSRGAVARFTRGGLNFLTNPVLNKQHDNYRSYPRS